MCCILFYNESYVASVVLMFLQVVSNNCWSVARVPSYTQYNLNKIITLYLCVLAHQVDLYLYNWVKVSLWHWWAKAVQHN